MSDLQEQAVQMISHLSDDNVVYLMDFIERFMLPKKTEGDNLQRESRDTALYMKELESLRMKMKPYFSGDFDYKKIWEDAVDEKYGSAD